MNRQLFQHQAEIYKALSSPKRLEILHHLRNGEKMVRKLGELVGICRSNLSQHLAVLCSRRLVMDERRGLSIQYRLSGPLIGRVYALIERLLSEQLLLSIRLVEQSVEKEVKKIG